MLGLKLNHVSKRGHWMMWSSNRKISSGPSKCKNGLSRYRFFHHRYQAVMRSSYVYNANPYTSKTTSLYWDDPKRLGGIALPGEHKGMGDFCGKPNIKCVGKFHIALVYAYLYNGPIQITTSQIQLKQLPWCQFANHKIGLLNNGFEIKNNCSWSPFVNYIC